MYRSLYTFGIKSYGMAIRLASRFSEKAKEWTDGRKLIFDKIAATIHHQDEIIWFHAASLGEAEQAVPVMEAIKEKYPTKKILLTFFSPSGMKHFKNEGLVDYVFYLPLDTPGNARKFLDAVKPQLAFFIKYEIWPNYFLELQRRKIPQVIAPAIFRRDHFYFKSPHKSFFLPIFKNVNRILVQDEASKILLTENDIERVKVVGDSRFDRVLQNTKVEFRDDILERFTKDQLILIGGSTWEPGEKILRKILDQNPELKMIIAPHDIKKENIERVHQFFGKERSFRYSTKTEDVSKYRVCIIDNIGMLSRLYRYGNIAYIGGAFGKGIHNSLEAAAYGLPLFFGPNHKNFIEPSEMMAEGFAFEISNAEQMQEKLLPLIQNPNDLRTKSAKARTYVESRAGVVGKIMMEVEKILT